MTYLLAQAYGQGAYSTSAYGTGVINIGPFTLPATGATELLLVLVGAALIGGAVGLVVWARQRRKRRLAEPTPS